MSNFVLVDAKRMDEAVRLYLVAIRVSGAVEVTPLVSVDRGNAVVLDERAARQAQMVLGVAGHYFDLDEYKFPVSA
jgi:hypothetical protein